MRLYLSSKVFLKLDLKCKRLNPWIRHTIKMSRRLIQYHILIDLCLGAIILTDHEGTMLLSFMSLSLWLIVADGGVPNGWHPQQEHHFHVLPWARYRFSSHHLAPKLFKKSSYDTDKLSWKLSILSGFSVCLTSHPNLTDLLTHCIVFSIFFLS